MAWVTMRLLDLGCKAGGASVGYQRAGLDVTGVDLDPQLRYPFPFIQADALTVSLDGYDLVAASMPCHDHTPLAALVGTNGSGWLLGALRNRLDASGLPYVLENVPGAPMRPDLKLCGCMFGLRTYRLRWFEFGGGWPIPPQPEHSPHTARTATSRRRERWEQGWHVSVTGDVGTYVGPEAMGIDWMTGDELSQAIPPAYTEYIGRELLATMTCTMAG